MNVELSYICLYINTYKSKNGYFYYFHIHRKIGYFYYFHTRAVREVKITRYSNFYFSVLQPIVHNWICPKLCVLTVTLFLRLNLVITILRKTFLHTVFISALKLISPQNGLEGSVFDEWQQYIRIKRGQLSQSPLRTREGTSDHKQKIIFQNSMDC